MKKIIQKLIVFVLFPFLMAFVWVIAGLFVAYACKEMAPDLSLFMPHTLSSSKLGLEIAFMLLISLVFSLVAWTFSWPLALVTLLLSDWREMTQELTTAAKIVLVVMMAGTAITVICSFAGMQCVLFEAVIGVFVPAIHRPQFHLPLSLFFLALAALITGFALAFCNLVRYVKTGMKLSAYLKSSNSSLAKFVSFFYPFNGLKFLLALVATITLTWSFYLDAQGSVLRFLAFNYGSVTWGVAALYLYAFVASKRGKGPELMAEFFREISDDIYVLVVFSLSILVFFLRLPKPYPLTNLDLGMLAPPYFLYVVLTLNRCRTVAVAGHFFPKRFVYAAIGVIALTYFLMFYIYYRIQTEVISNSEALWWQITMCTSSISAFFFAKLLYFFLRKQKLSELPEVLDALKSLKFTSGIYERMVEMIPAWNERVDLENAKLRKQDEEFSLKESREKIREKIKFRISVRNEARVRGASTRRESKYPTGCSFVDQYTCECRWKAASGRGCVKTQNLGKFMGRETLPRC